MSAKLTLAEAVELVERKVLYRAEPTSEYQEAWAAIKAALPVWRPIESAPSGQVIMLCDAHGNRWTDVGPGIETYTHNGCGSVPTHWMPLPEPPKS